MTLTTLIRWNYQIHRMQGRSIPVAALLALIDACKPADF